MVYGFTLAFGGLEERTRNVPRIAVSFLWLGLIVGAVALNMARYPGVSQMVSDSCRPQPLAQSATPSPPVSPASPLPPAPTSPRVESQPPAAAQRPALADRSAEAKDPSEPTQDRNAGPPSRTLARAVPEVPVVQAAVAVEPPRPVDPLDLGNGVRRLPPVE